jgi:hypothetical protein
MEIEVGGIAEVNLMIWRDKLYLGLEEKWSVKMTLRLLASRTG